MEQLGYKTEKEYVEGAKTFLLSPRGKHGDTFVRKHGDVCRYDYDTKEIAFATSSGIIKSYWNIGVDRGEEAADRYWQKTKKRG